MRAPLVLIIAALLTSCSQTQRLRYASSEVVREEGFATVVAPEEDLLTLCRILGPETDSTNGLVLSFKTPWEVLKPHTYRVPAGTVVFRLQQGNLSALGFDFGFRAKAGETYILRLEQIRNPKALTILEKSTGRIASLRAAPKRLQ